jgi:hypothetical protein
MLMTGDLDAAVALADQAEAIWRAAGVANNFSTRTVATQRANALYLRGDLLAALALLDVIDGDAALSESAPARAARDGTRAKLLALLGRSAEATALIDAASGAMCASVGPDSRDCMTMRLSGVDTKGLAGEAAAARRDLDAIRAALDAHPQFLPAAQAFGRVLALRLAPDEATLAAVLEALPATAATGALQRRNAVRSLLVLAENSRRSGREADAERLARAAIDTAGTAIDGTGMDRTLLSLWQARFAGQPAPATLLEQLAVAIGPDHPFVTSRLQSSPR